MSFRLFDFDLSFSRVLFCAAVGSGLLSACHPTGSDAPPKKSPQEVEALLRERVVRLTSQEMAGRETGTPGEWAAASYIDSSFQALGLLAKGDSLAFQPFSFKPHPPMQVHEPEEGIAQMGMALVQETRGYNVLYAIPAYSGKWGVIAAHYDHLGMGGDASLHRGDPAPHPGADDNASGVAVMLALAEGLMDQPVEHPLLFAAFSGEEKGLIGSNFFCENPTVRLDSIRYMINLDMVGRMHGDSLAVYGTGTSPRWQALLDSCNTEGLVLVPSTDGVGPSDHTSFYLENIPVLHFFTGQHADYHKPTDTEEKLDYAGMMKVHALVDRLVRALEQEKEWPFVATQDTTQRQKSPSFKVTLGVIPDYMYGQTGVKIDGVTAGRPAAKAGIQRGDIIRKMGDTAIEDLYDYMEILGILEPGMTTEIEIERNGKPMVLKVTWD